MPAPESPVRPQYDGASIAGLIPALVGGREADWLPESVTGATSVVLLVLDGLGWEGLETHRGALATLGGLESMKITTVVPSTTASALTSITTGLPPAQHGIVGFRMRVDREVLNVLSWQSSNGRRPPDPFTVQRHPPFLGRTVPVVTKSEFRSSGFSEAHLRDARFYGWHAPSSLVEHCRLLVAAGEPFVYAYYPGIDSVAHAHGLHDGFYQAELVAADRLVAGLLESLPPTAALLVTSDHGQVHVGADGWRELDAIADLVDVYSGEGRFRHLHARRGGTAELASTAREHLGDSAWVFTRDELLDEGWLGTPVGPAARRRVGDVVLAARGTAAFADPTMPREVQLISAHGSITASEMYVPLVSGRGTA
jgi:hypothetical protein